MKIQQQVHHDQVMLGSKWIEFLKDYYNYHTRTAFAIKYEDVSKIQCKIKVSRDVGDGLEVCSGGISSVGLGPSSSCIHIFGSDFISIQYICINNIEYVVQSSSKMIDFICTRICLLSCWKYLKLYIYCT